MFELGRKHTKNFPAFELNFFRGVRESFWKILTIMAHFPFSQNVILKVKTKNFHFVNENLVKKSLLQWL
jgi:hypothetical protein